MFETTPRTNDSTSARLQSPKRVIRAHDLASALSRVRSSYGEDALILETRQLTVRGEDGLAPRRVFEVVVADPRGSVETSTPETAPEDGGIDHRLRRMQSIARRVRDMAEQIDRWRAAEVNDYPLAAVLLDGGCSMASARQLAAQFQLAARGGEPTLTAARRHLSRVLRGTGALRVDAMRGEHWFLGRAGVGKTTLALQLAARLRGSGKRVALIATSPQHDGELHRIRSAGEALGITSVAVRDEADMREARAHVEGVDVVLVDTPCYLGPGLAVTPGEDAHRHLVVSLGDERVALRQQLRGAEAWSPDTLAVTQMDLFPHPGRLVELALEVGRPVSFLQGRQDGAVQLNLAQGEHLLHAVLGDLDEIETSRAARA